jgi:protein involved in polysaccharide export with SLBB domain
MGAVRRRSLRWGCAAAPLFGLLAGCGLGHPQVDQALLDRKVPAARRESRAAGYTVHFPDVLDVRVEGVPAWSGRMPVRLDGRAGPGDGIRAEGRTVSEVAALIAERTGVAPELVHVTVASYGSRHVFLHGEVQGEPRAVAYQGPETVLELLQRAGGITSGAAPRDVKVVRAHVADGRPPEVFEVDLVAILQKNDARTNVRLQPFDQVYIGQSQRSSLRKCFPPWLRHVYEQICGLYRPKQKAKHRAGNPAP